MSITVEMTTDSVRHDPTTAQGQRYGMRVFELTAHRAERRLSPKGESEYTGRTVPFAWASVTMCLPSGATKPRIEVGWGHGGSSVLSAAEAQVFATLAMKVAAIVAVLEVAPFCNNPAGIN